jgi:GDP-4-dehydro-6-deoxy-D-mannose reductase
MRILVTGATGFVGGHLAETLLAAGGAEVHGLALQDAWPAALAHLAGDVRLHATDLAAGAAGVEAVLRDVRPDHIYHLAGFADPGASFRDPEAAWAGNLAATRTLYYAIARSGGTPRVLYVSSGHVYGAAGEAERAVDEQAALCPASPYAASKAAADQLSYQVTRHPGLDVVRVRPFNQIGPRQPPQYAAGHFARQLARIERGLAPPRLEVGDLSARRDLTDVRDMVAAYRLLLTSGRAGEVYNAGSGRAVRMTEVLDTLRALCVVPVEVVVRTERLRPSDPGALVAESSALRTATGWRRRYSLEQSLRDTLDSWRQAVAAEG